MAKFFDRLTPEICAFIQQQKLFFVATAPPMTDGRINLSPKGLDTLRILADDTVAYLDLTGSGNETAAHLRHDPGRRITFMFCSFDDRPKILRLYGRGEVLREGDPAWNDLIGKFPIFLGTRQIILMKITSGQTSCGFGVPQFELVADRTLMRQWEEKKGPEGLREYHRSRNRVSIDGLETGL